ncbi:cell wall-active antibiotics response protein LiaF [Thalassobacillus sp. CUG 92003]|uniref:cell wall-active antibiotics response protein LiaF n=1 Tax=Thalassobacillus sp. CUG 92003 TaxID=2736641 RepID=UPI0015E6B5FA
MFQRMSTDTLNMIIIIGVILLVVEVAFFNGGLIFSVMFSGLMIYFGLKRYHRFWGKVLFWIGAVSLFFTVLNMIAVRFVLIALVVMFLLSYQRSKTNPDHIKPDITEPSEAVIPQDPLFRQKFFGDQKTDSMPYKWNDINIHGGFGDRVIDLSNTVLPDDEAVISIRHMIGNIEILVPYEVEVSVHHSALLGRVRIFHHQKERLFNQLVSYKTEHYATEKPRVKIVTSMVSGDIEVKRI